MIKALAKGGEQRDIERVTNQVMARKILTTLFPA
jgi:hypothetical protein